MFSFIIPCYNGEKTIIRCLDSIVKQSYSDYEIIIINDGSTDNSQMLIESFIAKHSSIDIKLYNVKNGGHGAARNLGVMYAKKEYIWFIDADDLLYNDDNTLEVEKAAEDIISNNYPDIYIFSVFETDFIKRNKVWNYTSQPKLTTIKKSPFLLFKQNWVWNKPMKRDFLIDVNVKFTSLLMFEDIYYMSSLYTKASSIYITRDIKYVYVKHPDSLTASLSNFKGYPKALFHELVTFFKVIFRVI